jgi:hypothetical protein
MGLTWKYEMSTVERSDAWHGSLSLDQTSPFT